MAECGICLDQLKTPVSIPCGHIHCEKCLREYIGAGADALKSTCPTCRKPFHIASPDFAFVPKKYHDFILPSVRKIYMDVSSLASLTEEVEILTSRLQTVARDKTALIERCQRYKDAIDEIAGREDLARTEAEDARNEAAEIKRKYESLKKKYWESQPRDPPHLSASHNLSRRSSQNFEIPRESTPKVQDVAVNLNFITPDQPRPKRGLPKSRLSRRQDFAEPPPQFVKRQRTGRNSDVDSSSS
ncbi:hypothetical protein HYDPIDRAFT_75157, partial [Hydnomerulius pinastri MD-312]